MSGIFSCTHFLRVRRFCLYKRFSLRFEPHTAAADSNAKIRRGAKLCKQEWMAIIVDKADSVEKLNAVLHEFGEYIIGRMGLPYRARHVNILSVAIDAPQDVISALAGRLGNIVGISVKTAYSNVISD